MDNKRKYAKFLIEGCLNLSADDKLFIISSTIINDFTNLVIDEAHKLGITKIETLMTEPFKQKELYLNNSYEEIINSPYFSKEKYNKMAKEGYAFLNLFSPMPGFFDEVNSELLSQVSKYQTKSISLYRDYQNKGLIKWNISAVPNNLWAKSIDKLNGIDELWDLVYNICLIKTENPKLAWQEKINKLQKRAKYLNNLQITKLVYKNSLGTDLEIGLPKGYLFQSAEGKNLVNMPTEEVFTSPNRLEVNGKVYSATDLYYNNNLISNFWLEFKDGQIINFDAERGKEILKGIIETDEGSHYLGEVALVDYDSPISNTNIIFKNTLYDENASCHLAIGESFAECLQNGLNMNNEELLYHGLNQSNEHVDFFIGTPDLKIKAVLPNGEDLVIMENGNFVEVQ